MYITVPLPIFCIVPFFLFLIYSHNQKPPNSDAHPFSGAPPPFSNDTNLYLSLFSGRHPLQLTLVFFGSPVDELHIRQSNTITDLLNHLLLSSATPLMTIILVMLVLAIYFGVIIINNEIGQSPFTNWVRRYGVHTRSDKCELGNTGVQGQRP